MRTLKPEKEQSVREKKESGLMHNSINLQRDKNGAQTKPTTVL